MEKIKFKESKLINTLGYTMLACGVLIMYSTYGETEGLIMGFVSTLLGLYYFHTNQINSIKKYLNENRRI